MISGNIDLWIYFKTKMEGFTHFSFKMTISIFEGFNHFFPLVVYRILEL